MSANTKLNLTPAEAKQAQKIIQACNNHISQMNKHNEFINQLKICPKQFETLKNYYSAITGLEVSQVGLIKVQDVLILPQKETQLCH